MVATNIRGTNKSYPPVISAIKKIAVKGACNTPAMRPVIPSKVKLASETSNPNWLMAFATALPNALPINNVGIKIPPTPPAAKVVVIAIALKTAIISSITITIQILLKSI